MRQSTSSQWLDVLNPANQEVLAQVPLATEDEVNEAIASAKEAFKTWKDVPVTERARIMMRYAQLLKEHHDEIATIICHELGKTFEDAKGDVWRGIEVVEQAANAPSNMMGETVSNVARNIDTYSLIQPLGVCAGI
ncbi:aldehyde dehydrogenase family protein, partial [Pseudoalteromonas sp. S407]